MSKIPEQDVDVATGVERRDSASLDLERETLLARLKRLEDAARALDPGANRRKKLRNAIVASSERFLRKLRSGKAYDETTDKGSALLDTPISESGIPIEKAVALLEYNVLRPGANP